MDQPRIELLVLLGSPLVMGVIVALLGPRRASLVRWLSLATAVLSLLLALILTGRLMHLEKDRAHQARPPVAGVAVPTFHPDFVPGSSSTDPADANSHTTTWRLLQLGPGAVQFYVGIDGMNVWLVLLTAVLFMPSVLISWTQITERVNEFYAWLLILQTAMFGVFLSFDILLFYVFFELTLVPLFFLIGIWGGPERRYAARKFLIYTLTGSLITLLGVLGIVLACYTYTSELTFSIPKLVELVHRQLAIQDPAVQAYWGRVQFWVFLALMAGFAVKVPLVPLHTWLPLAHVEAPTAGSVDLAGVLLKVGAYGFLRLCLPLAPDASVALGQSLIAVLAAIGIVYGAFCALTQDDIKRLVAYSSVSHLGLAMLGMFAFNAAGLGGSLLQMINHGINTGALFLLVGMLYERYHTRKVSDYSGMAARLPILACFMVFICLASIGLPGLNGFVSELLVLMGVLQMEWGRAATPWLAAATASTIILGAWYLLTLLRRTFFGPVKEPAHEGHEIHDLNRRELLTLAPLVILCIVLGIHPQPVLDTSRRDLEVITEITQKARTRGLAARFGRAREQTEDNLPSGDALVRSERLNDAAPKEKKETP